MTNGAPGLRRVGLVDNGKANTTYNLSHGVPVTWRSYKTLLFVLTVTLTSTSLAADSRSVRIKAHCLFSHCTSFSHNLDGANQLCDLNGVLNIYVRYVNRVCVWRARCVSCNGGVPHSERGRTHHTQFILVISSLSFSCLLGWPLAPAAVANP